jgi:hypothetical protein
MRRHASRPLVTLIAATVALVLAPAGSAMMVRPG